MFAAVFRGAALTMYVHKHDEVVFCSHTNSMHFRDTDFSLLSLTKSSWKSTGDLCRNERKVHVEIVAEDH